MSYVIGSAQVRSDSTTALEAATINWPLTSGDRIQTNEHSRAELDFGAGKVWLDGSADLSVLELDDAVARIALQAGTVDLQLREHVAQHAFSVELDHARIVLKQPGAYRIEIGHDGSARVIVRSGEAEVQTGQARFQQLSGERADVAPDGTVAISQKLSTDAFDRWALQRAQNPDGTRTASHVAPGLVGYEDLDAYGTWRWERDLGMVWQPERVSHDWAPYRFGQWIWKQPWGWTWVDDAPWGFAPFHYGRWAEIDNRWVWVAGPRQIAPPYAPALVSWARYSDQPHVIGWAPLSPGEVFTPSYPASEGYVRSLNTFGTLRSQSSPTLAVSRPEHSPRAFSWNSDSMFAGHSLPQSWPETRRLAADPGAGRAE